MLNPQACFHPLPFFACLFCSFFARVIMQNLNAANPGNSSPSPATAPSRRPAGWKISQLSRCLVKLCKRPLHCAKRITYSLVIAMSVYCTHTHTERRRERKRKRERQCHNCWPRCLHLLAIGWKLRKCVKCCGQRNEATVPHVCLRLIADVGNSASRAQTEWVSCACQNSGNCDGSLMWDFSGILQSVDKSPASDYSLKRLGQGV